MTPDWPLTGRSEHLRTIADTLKGGRSPAGTVLIGPPGVGKTRLAAEAVAEAARRGALTHWAAGTPGARAVPLGAFATWAVPVDTGAAEALYRTRQALFEGADQGGHQGSGQGAGRAAPRRRLVLGIDDAQLLDDLSALLVQQLALEGAAGLVLTVRSGEPVPEAVAGLWRSGQLRRLDLPPLDLAECGQLLAAVLGGPVDSVSAKRLWHLTEGNALFLRHLVEGERATGGLYKAAETWRWKGVPMVTPTLVDLIAARMGELPDPVREIVDYLALGEPLDIRLLARLVPAGPADPVEAAEERGLVTVTEDENGRLNARLAHPLYGEVRRAGLGTLRGRRLRGTLARALDPGSTLARALDPGSTVARALDPERADGRRGPYGALRTDSISGTGTWEEPTAPRLRRALLRLDSDLPPDPGLSLRSAQQAALLADMPLAERLARAALTGGAGFPAQLVVATAVAAQSRTEQLAAELEELTRLARTDLEHVQAAVPQIMGLALIAQDPAAAHDALTATAARLRDPVAHCHLAGIRGYLGVLAGGSRMSGGATGLSGGGPELSGGTSAPVTGTPALSVGADSLERARPPGGRVMSTFGDTAALRDADTAAQADQPEPLLLAHLTRTIAHAVGGRGGPAREAAGQARAALARSWQLGYLRTPLSLAEVVGAWLSGRTGEAVALAELHREAEAAVPFGPERSHCVLGEAVLEQGRTADAEHLLREAVDGLREHGTAGGFLQFALVALARARALLGRRDEARHTLTQAESVHSPVFAVRDPELWVTRAWVAAAEGALSEAVAHARTGAQLAASRHHFAYEVWALHTAVRLGDARRATADRLAELELQVGGPAAQGAARHAHALADDDGEALRAAALLLLDGGAPAAAADAHAQAADAFQRAGRSGSAGTEAAAADRLAADCQGLRTPALLAFARPLPLTRREREIALLAAAGLTNQQIADRLTLSVRTVEGHLYRLSAKLGVTSRAELARVLDPSRANTLRP
ncbi:AAA family ATPase [Streptomyces sp. TRM66268-LWL]|uniref:AAA family ATPase n=1 Tax=Streptomyces polyasparticus TaxID=2767826 RepID=A0ABR7SWV4_9ACTN|nr:LuxR family transcriptional regulator [Streptomyces polyasparticus]MBC9719140.1 AAA family ATPase [Streptomyces polyasparticus]